MPIGAVRDRRLSGRYRQTSASRIEPAAEQHRRGRRVLLRRDEVRPDRVQQRFDQRDDRGLLRRDRAQARA